MRDLDPDDYALLIEQLTAEQPAGETDDRDDDEDFF